MNKNYLISAHKNPEQLSRLISRLDDGSSRFYVHMDLKTEIQPFKNAISSHNVIFIENRIDCIWGDFSQVEVTLNLINAVIKENNNFYSIFISGQDYPIKSTNKINKYLEENKIYEHIDFKLYDIDLKGKPIPVNSDFYKYRIDCKKINLSSRKEDFLLMPSFKTLFSLDGYKIPLRLLQFIKKGRFDLISEAIKAKPKSPFSNHYLGSQWWGFTPTTLDKMFEYITSNREMLFRYYQSMLCADELFFQTILKHLMSIDQSIKVKENLTYFDFFRGDGSSPITFEENDFEILTTQPENKLFARKFDIDIDPKILDLIDNHID